jgi:hypothetical protein
MIYFTFRNDRKERSEFPKNYGIPPEFRSHIFCSIIPPTYSSLIIQLRTLTPQSLSLAEARLWQTAWVRVDVRCSSIISTESLLIIIIIVVVVVRRAIIWWTFIKLGSRLYFSLSKIIYDLSYFSIQNKLLK